MVLDGTGSVYDDTGWYLVSISWYCLILGGTWSAKGLYACIYWKKWRFGQVLPMPDTQTDRQTTEERATQLLYSIQFKLSHAMISLKQRFATRPYTCDLDNLGDKMVHLTNYRSFTSSYLLNGNIANCGIKNCHNYFLCEGFRCTI